jgi:CxxC motif-containing protein
MDMICIVCPMGCKLSVEMKDENIIVQGNNCKRGEEFAKSEMINPVRTLTTTIKTTFKEMPLLPVRTDGEIQKGKIFDAMKVLNKLVIDYEAKCGDVILENIVGSGCNVIATNSINK